MRKLILILWAGILSVFSISCYDDEGSNDYHPINEVKISDWKKGGYTAIFKNDTLKITPLSYLDMFSRNFCLYLAANYKQKNTIMDATYMELVVNQPD